MTLFGTECPGHNPPGGVDAEEPSEPDFCDGACVRTTPITNEQYENLTGGTTVKLIAIEIDREFSPHERETADKIASGEWEAYGVGLMNEGPDGVLRIDYSQYKAPAVAPAGANGFYPDPSLIKDDLLRSLARELLTEEVNRLRPCGCGGLGTHGVDHSEEIEETTP